MTGTANPFGKILLYIDGSESSITAALFAIIRWRRRTVRF